jgi:hypothetical protein
VFPVILVTELKNEEIVWDTLSVECVQRICAGENKFVSSD